jgi:hypothetical protein
MLRLNTPERWQIQGYHHYSTKRFVLESAW